jgi:hypothetical protein
MSRSQRQFVFLWAPIALFTSSFMANFCPARSTNKEALTSICQVDFKNFPYPWDTAMEEGPAAEYPAAATTTFRPYIWLNPLPQQHVRTTNGLYRFFGSAQDSQDPQQEGLLSVDRVIYGASISDGTEEAAVHLNYSGGGTANWDFLYIYALSSGQPKLLALLGAGSRAYGGLGHVEIANRILTLDFNDPDRRQGDCCSEGYVRVHFLWQENHFAPKGPVERGDWPKQN